MSTHDLHSKVEEAQNTSIPEYHSTRVLQNNSTTVSTHDLHSKRPSAKRRRRPVAKYYNSKVPEYHRKVGPLCHPWIYIFRSPVKSNITTVAKQSIPEYQSTCFPQNKGNKASPHDLHSYRSPAKRRTITVTKYVLQCTHGLYSQPPLILHPDFCQHHGSSASAMLTQHAL